MEKDESAELTELLIESKLIALWVDAKEMGIEPGWLWLYRNGFAERVPMEVQTIIDKQEGRKLWEK